MTFDISTAKPAGQKESGFDISTAQQAQQPQDVRKKLLQEQAAEQGGLDAFLVGAGRGMTTIGRALGLADPEDPIVKEAFQELEKLRPITTGAGEVVGETAPFLLPGAGVGAFGALGTRAAASTALGALEGGLIAKGKGGDEEKIIKSAGAGGVISGSMELAFPRISRFVGKSYRKLTGKAPDTPLLTPDGQPTEELTKALNDSGLTFGDLTQEMQRAVSLEDVSDPAAAARKAFLESEGLTPTRAQMTGDVTDFQTQQELYKKTGDVRRAIATQEEVIASKFDNAISETGGSANASNSPAFDYIADKSIDLDAAISEAYRQAVDVASDAKIIKLDNMVNAIKSIAGSDRATGGLPTAAKDILKDKGVITGNKLKATGRVTAEVAEEVRKDLNALYNSVTDFGRSKLSTLKSAVDKDVEKTVGEDVFKGARAAKAKFERDLSRAKVNKFDKRQKSLVRDILENKVDPDRFLDQAVLSKSVRSSDVKQLKDFLALDGDEAGLEAWNSIRAEAMQRIKDVAIKEVGGEPAMTRASINKALNQFGKDKLNVLFKPQERTFLEKMKKISSIREPKRGTALGKGPSAQAVEALVNTASRSPVLSAVFGAALETIKDKAKNKAALRPAKIINELAPSDAARRLSPALIPATQDDE